MSKAYRDDEAECCDEYERLEKLLRQTLTLAGEIVESKGRPLPGECIALRKRAISDPTGARPHDIRSSLLKRRNDLVDDESEDSQSTSPSPASSVQEPFSPASLAVSLDAVVEQGGRTQNDLCVLDNASNTSVAALLAEPTSNRSSILSTDETQRGLIVQTFPPQNSADDKSPKKLHRPSLPQKNTSMIVHSGQESLVEPLMEPFAPQQLIENPRNERLGRRSTPIHVSPQGSPTGFRTPKSHPNSDPALKRPQKIKGQSLEGDNMAANQSRPPKWHVKILPVASARKAGDSAHPAPALVKFEVVFPLRAFAESNATSSPAYNSEPSYIIIGRVPLDHSPESPGSSAEEEAAPAAHEKSLQEVIDEWECDAEAPGVKEKR
ncbi:hypothetical protein J7T55_001098 [Diaporthe amygdali]|uniref:uncharacterized protein n=1 Tax=Phomopsis amygdali TaxID=1214568 RepID=UPI0022FDF0F2|nr:uncharacterized protein J7T55_001098 [Diaporthe amygdali]KAJ0120241.1 hypothetical protein J7T55_001098 [Diaporthe amygdali]